jgi:hypothetical protein
MGLHSNLTHDKSARADEVPPGRRQRAHLSRCWTPALICLALPFAIGACDSGFSHAGQEEALVFEGDISPSQVVPHRLELFWCPAEGDVLWTLDFGLQGDGSAQVETPAWPGGHSFFMHGPGGGAGMGAGGMICGCGHGPVPCGFDAAQVDARSWRIEGVMSIGSPPTEADVNISAVAGVGPIVQDPGAPFLSARFELLPPEEVEGSGCAPIPVEKVTLTQRKDPPSNGL